MSMARTYCNPVYPAPLADPFVLKHEGLYYAYGTAPAGPGGGQVPVLRSPDLVGWEPLGYALGPQGEEAQEAQEAGRREGEAGPRQYWAPEVACHEGRFYMYYSSGCAPEGTDQQLRVAVAAHPAGPFAGTGSLLVPGQPFSIDAHPYRHIDGAWYLFYCVDFLDAQGGHRAGTGIVVDRLLDMCTLAGQPCLVVRPHQDWQVFRKGRTMYGRVFDWHTVEGPSVLVHGGRVYCFYSGGAWERDNYGVSYAVADHPLGPYRYPEGGHEALLMRSRPGAVVGPGHNSFTTSPDGRMLSVTSSKPDRKVL